MMDVVSPTARPQTSRRSYDQYCAIARALDVLGDRWTLLIARDLLLGPKRYRDLLDGLPGIGTNLLAARLRELESAGVVVRRTLPPPAGSTVYELTDAGLALEPVMLALGRFGSRFLGPPRSTDNMRPTPFFLAMRAAFRPERADGLDESYEVRVDDRTFEVRVARGEIGTREGPATAPDVVLELDVETLSGLLFGELTPAQAMRNGTARVVAGDKQALSRFIGLFAFGAARD
jgi:DNA-binding HxlR family transcriptional regulator/putative sterol carrier protein